MPKKHFTNSTNQVNYKKLTLVGLIILLVLFSCSLLFSYLNFYPRFLDKKTIFTLDSFVASIPLIPKSPKQIVTKALANAAALESYSFKLSGEVKNEKISLLSLSIVGQVEKAGLISSKDYLQTKISTSLGEADFESLEDRENFFFKIKQTSATAGFDFSKLNKNSWYQVDLNTFQKNMGANSKSDREIISDVAREFNKVKSEIISSKFPEVKDFREVSKKNEKYYQIKLLLNNLKINNTFLGEEFDTKKTSVEFLISKKTFFFHKITLNNTSDFLAKDMTENFSYEISKINEKQQFPNVASSKIIKSPIELYTLVNPNVDFSGANYFTALTDSTDFGGNFLTFERLLKVLVLLPKAL